MPSSIIPIPGGGKIVKTNCFECHTKCGVLCTVDSDGNLVSVKGNPEDPRSEGRMCSKGLSATRILYSPIRNNYPLRRVGKKGEGKWERITWDEAYDTIVNKLKEIEQEHGAEAIAYGQGTGRGYNQWTLRSGHSSGRVHHNFGAGYNCLVPMMIQSFHQFGMMCHLEGSDFEHSDCMVFWGSNTSWTEACYTSGQVGRGRDNGAKIIVIDPFFEHPLAAKADHFIPVRPGADPFIAMAWIHVIMNEDLYDHEFVTKYSNAPMLITADTELPITGNMLYEGGNPNEYYVWDKTSRSLKSIKDKNIEEDLWYQGPVTLVDGTTVDVKTVWVAQKQRADEWPPARAAEMAWVNPQVIIDSCRTYAKAKSAAISTFQGTQLHTNSKDCLQLINTIIIMTGNVEKPGGNVSAPFYKNMSRLAGKRPPTQLELHLREEELCKGAYYDASFPHAIMKAIRTGKPYPVKAAVIVAGNLLSVFERTDLVKESLLCLDFLVVMDYFMSPTAELADIVLPAAHWTEVDYIADECCGDYQFGQQKAVEPLYERRSNITFLRTLGNQMYPDKWPWQTDEEMFDWQLSTCKDGITWQELKDNWIHRVPDLPSRQYRQYGFETPTGRAEIYSLVGLRLKAPPMASAVDDKRSPYANPEMAAKYPIIGVTGRRYPHFYHSAYRGIPHLREITPHPEVTFSSKLAKKLGIKAGEDVWIESPFGKITMKARPSDGLHERVAMIPHGWWQGCPELKLPDYPDGIANANMLVGDDVFNDEYMSPSSRNVLCKIYKK